MTLDTIITKLFINNEFVDSESKQTFDTINPATEEVLATVQRADSQDVDKAVNSAKAAFSKWRDVSGPARRDLILKYANLMQENQQYLAEIESADNGKPVSIARDVDIQLGIKCLKYFAGWADKLHGKTIPVENTASMAFTIHEPIGVVASIIPWNFPILMFVWKIGKSIQEYNQHSFIVRVVLLLVFHWIFHSSPVFTSYSSHPCLWLHMHHQIVREDPSYCLAHGTVGQGCRVPCRSDQRALRIWS
jgi:hypothetical protein